jgi:hypothetical protein
MMMGRAREPLFSVIDSIVKKTCHRASKYCQGEKYLLKSLRHMIFRMDYL